MRSQSVILFGNGKKKTAVRPRFRSVTARSLPDFVDVVQGLQDEWPDLEAEQTQKDDEVAIVMWGGRPAWSVRGSRCRLPFRRV